MRFDIREFGAVGGGETVNTTALQSAIDDCSQAGGGIVVVAGGRYVTGTLFLKDGVTLEIAGGSALVGSPNIADYATDTHKNMYKCEPHMNRCLIFASGARHIGICGSGEIDGQGALFPNAGDAGGNRPMLIRLLECEGIRMRDVTLRNPAAWTTAWLYCNDIVVDGVRIHSRANGNGDGLDFDGCCRVRVTNCSFDTSDDSICLQTSRPDRPCRDITISNCDMCSYWGGVRIGLLSRANIENVALSNCVFSDIRDAGIKIEMCEGADTVDNSAAGKNTAFFITGLPGHDLENIRFSDISMVAEGGGTVEEGAQRDVIEFDDETLDGWWPGIHIVEGRKGVLPLHGFFARHVRGLHLDQADFSSVATDARPAVILENVRDVSLSSIRTNPDAAGEAALRLRNVQGARLSNCVPPPSGALLLQVEGTASARIHLDSSTTHTTNQ
jgi:hypothetical protein